MAITRTFYHMIFTLYALFHKAFRSGRGIVNMYLFMLNFGTHTEPPAALGDGPSSNSEPLVRTTRVLFQG